MLVPGPPSMASSTVLRLGGPPMPYDPTYHLLWRPDKIREAVRAACPDVVEIHSPYVAALGVLAAKPGSFGIRTFVWHSDFIDTYERVLTDNRAWARPAARALGVPLWAWVRAIAGACAATFCASAWQASKLARHGVDAERIPFGVDKLHFRPRPRAARAGVTLVASGRLAIEKRWDTVLEAFARFSARRPDARLILFGDGPERARLEALAPKNVYFAGFERDREKLAAALADADALVHGCPHETFGIAVAEAIACGAPVVVPDEGGAAELARPDFRRAFARATRRDARRRSSGSSRAGRAREGRRRGRRPRSSRRASTSNGYSPATRSSSGGRAATARARVGGRDEPRCVRAGGDEPGMRRHRVHVSIHDVSPAFAAEIDDALEACARAGATPALLVVPNFHGEWPLEEHPRFVDRLRELAARGHEILLHGFFHRASGAGRGVRSAFAQRVASAGEAEFADLPREEGERRLDEGAAALRRARPPDRGLRRARVVDGALGPPGSRGARRPLRRGSLSRLRPGRTARAREPRLELREPHARASRLERALRPRGAPAARPRADAHRAPPGRHAKPRASARGRERPSRRARHVHRGDRRPRQRLGPDSRCARACGPPRGHLSAWRKAGMTTSAATAHAISPVIASRPKD